MSPGRAAVQPQELEKVTVPTLLFPDSCSKRLQILLEVAQQEIQTF